MHESEGSQPHGPQPRRRRTIALAAFLVLAVLAPIVFVATHDDRAADHLAATTQHDEPSR